MAVTTKTTNHEQCDVQEVKIKSFRMDIGTFEDFHTTISSRQTRKRGMPY